jgi:hypothetical protein
LSVNENDINKGSSFVEIQDVGCIVLLINSIQNHIQDIKNLDVILPTLPDLQLFSNLRYERRIIFYDDGREWNDELDNNLVNWLHIINLSEKEAYIYKESCAELLYTFKALCEYIPLIPHDFEYVPRRQSYTSQNYQIDDVNRIHYAVVLSYSVNKRKGLEGFFKKTPCAVITWFAVGWLSKPIPNTNLIYLFKQVSLFRVVHFTKQNPPIAK